MSSRRVCSQYLLPATDVRRILGAERGCIYLLGRRMGSLSCSGPRTATSFLPPSSPPCTYSPPHPLATMIPKCQVFSCLPLRPVPLPLPGAPFLIPPSSHPRTLVPSSRRLSGSSAPSPGILPPEPARPSTRPSCLLRWGREGI